MQVTMSSTPEWISRRGILALTSGAAAALAIAPAWLRAQQAAVDQPPVPFIARDLVGIAGGERLPFVRNAAGRVGWVLEGNRLLPRVGAT